MNKKQESINALKYFIQNIYLTEELTPKQSIKNLENSLIELIDYSNKKHVGNGILITENGYFLTAHHCIEGFIEKDFMLVQDYQNKKYDILKICKKNKKEDLALVKAEIAKKPISKKYKIYNTNSLNDFYLWNFPVNLKTKRNGKIENNYGLLIKTKNKNKITKTKKIYENQFKIQMQTKNGDSGGIIMDKDGRLMGIHSNASEVMTGDSKVFSGLDLVQKYINELEKQTKITYLFDNLRKFKRNLIRFILEI